MEDESLCYMPATEMVKMIKRKKVSPVEIIESILTRIQRLNPKINAYCSLVAEKAKKDAKHAEEVLFRREKLGPLHGVPISIKDLIFTKGIRTTFGSKMYENFIPDQDEVVVKRLKAAGAILLGKTNTSEFGYKAVTDNTLFGITRNPWNLGMTPGGSSGGGAAAVATGLGPISLGSDAGGSIRVPASFCGIFGLKPSKGRIPIHPILSGWENLDRRLVHLGPLTRTVADSALMMEVMAGPDERDPSSLYIQKVAYRRELKRGIRGLKIAWSTDLNSAIVAPHVKDTVESAIKIFSELGCHVEEVKLELPSVHEAFNLIFAADCAGALGNHLSAWKDQLDQRLVRLVEIGLKVTAEEYVRAANTCHLLWNRLQPLFEQYDLLLTPTLPVTPFMIGVDWPREVVGQKVHPLNYVAFTYPFNITGQPAATIPCGWTVDGLPIGLQIIGKHFDDVTVLRGAAAFEEANPWQNKKPKIE